MREASYAFDPCTIDASDQEEVGIDNWKPTEFKHKLTSSKWRQKQIGTDFDQQPGLDELKKIYMFLKKKSSDSEIMHAFGITAETLVAIKKHKYCPIDGISLDNLSKIYNEFQSLENKLASLMRGVKYIGNIMFVEKKDVNDFKNSFRKPKKNKSVENLNDSESSECEEDVDLSEKEE